MRSFWIGTLILSLCAPSQAEGLKQYKQQKHQQYQKTPTGEVATKPCGEAFEESCVKGCAAGDAACRAKCHADAGPFCAAREQKRSSEEAALYLKALLLFAGPLITLLDGPRQYASQGGDNPFQFYWDLPSYNLDVGGGLLQGKTYAISASAAFRIDHFGLGGNASYLTQNGDTLAEFDLGPSFYLGSTHLSAAITPSVLASGGSGIEPKYGGGVRTTTTAYFDPLYILFSPLLGKINGQWQFQFKAGLGWRFNPNFGMHFTFEHRSVVDLNSLLIPTSSLNGVFLYLSLRGN